MKRGYDNGNFDVPVGKRVYRAIEKKKGYIKRQPVMLVRAPLATRGFYPRSSSLGRRELKTIDALEVRINPVTGLAAPTFALLNGVATGDDFNSRDGRQIVIKSIYFRADLQPYGNTMSYGDTVRCMIVQDTQPNGVIFTVGDLFTATTNTYGSVAMNNLNNRSRFKVLMDKQVSMDPAIYAASVLTGGNPSTKTIKKFIKCHIPVQYSGTGATIASIATNSLYLVVFSDNQLVDFRSSTRVRFVDV